MNDTEDFTNVDLLDLTQTISNREAVLSVVICDDSLYFGVDSGDIHVWNINYFKNIATLRGHSRAVLCLYARNELLYSASAGGRIIVRRYCYASELSVDRYNDDDVIRLYAPAQIWSTKSLERQVTIEGLIGSVFSMLIFRDSLILGCQDTTIKVRVAFARAALKSDGVEHSTACARVCVSVY